MIKSIANTKATGKCKTKELTMIISVAMVAIIVILSSTLAMISPNWFDERIQDKVDREGGEESVKLVEDQPEVVKDSYLAESGYMIDRYCSESEVTELLAHADPVWTSGEWEAAFEFMMSHFNEGTQTWHFEGPSAEADTTIAASIYSSFSDYAKVGTRLGTKMTQDTINRFIEGIIEREKTMFATTSEVDKIDNPLRYLSRVEPPGNENIGRSGISRGTHTRGAMGEAAITDTGGNLDIYTSGSITFTIPITTPMENITSAVLTLSIWDVDETPDSEGKFEVDEVYINGDYLGTLTGANDQWSTSTFIIDPSFLESNNSIKIVIDLRGEGWLVECDWGELDINGGEQLGGICIDSLEIDKIAYQLGQAIQVTGIIAASKDFESVRAETNLHNPNGINVDGTSETFSIDKDQHHTVKPSLIIPSGGDAGIYTLVMLLHSKGIQDTKKIQIIVGSDIILQDKDIIFKSMNTDSKGIISDIDLEVSVEFKSEDTSATEDFEVVFFEVNLTSNKAIHLHTEKITMSSGAKMISFNWKVTELNSKFQAIADPSNKVKEILETNNVGDKKIEGKPVVDKVDMKYKGYFIHGIETKNEFTAHVSSFEETVKKVRFMVDDNTKYLDSNGADGWVWKDYDMGELEQDSTFKIIAYGESGQESVPYTFEVKVWKLPWWLEEIVKNDIPLTIPGLGDNLKAEFVAKDLKFSITWTIVDKEDIGLTVPKSIPYIGGDYKFSLKVTIGADAYLSGRIEVKGEGELKMTVMGYDGEGKLSISGDFSAGMPPAFHGMSITASAKIKIPLNKVLGIPDEICLPDVKIGPMTIRLSSLGAVKIDVSISPHGELTMKFDNKFSMTEAEIKPGIELTGGGGISADWRIIGAVSADLELKGDVTGSVKVPSWDVTGVCTESLTLKVKVRSWEKEFNPLGGPWTQDLQISSRAANNDQTTGGITWLPVSDWKVSERPEGALEGALNSAFADTKSSPNELAATRSGNRGTGVSDQLTNDLLYDGTPSIALPGTSSGAGSALSTWIHDSGVGDLPGSMDVYTSAWNPDTSSWSTPTTVDQNSNIDSSPTAIYTSEGAPMVIWTHEFASPDHINPFASIGSTEIVYSTYGSGIWSSKQKITDNSMIEGNPAAATDFSSTNGDTVVAWEVDSDNDLGTTDDAEIYYSIYDVLTTSWSTPTALILGGYLGLDSQPQLKSLGNGDFMVVWLNDADGNESTRTDQKVVYSIFDKGTEMWSIPATVYFGHIYPSYDMDANSVGDVGLVFVKKTGSQQNDSLYFTIYNSSTGWFTPVEVLKRYRIDQPRINGYGSNKFAVSFITSHADNSGIGGDIYSMIYTYSGTSTSWSSPRPVTNDSFIDTDIAAVFDSSSETEYIVWLKRGCSIDSNYDVFTTVFQTEPDIIVSSDALEISDTSAKPGSTVRLRARIQNLGDTEAGQFTVRFTTGDGSNTAISEIGTQSVPGLAAGSATIVEQDWQVPTYSAGNEPFVIYVTVDSNYDIAEQNETNNQAYLPLFDLFLVEESCSVGYEPVASASATYDQTYATLKVANDGLITIPNVLVNIYNKSIDLGGVLINSSRITILDPNTQQEVNIHLPPNKFTGSLTSLYVTVEHQGSSQAVFFEFNSDNNHLDLDAAIFPDVTIDPGNITLSKIAKGTVTIYASVTNIGPVLSETFTVSAYDGDPNNNGSFIGNTTLASIGVGSTRTAEFTWISTAGAHYIYVIVNGDNTMLESDAGNNMASNEFIISGVDFGIDLVVTSSSISFTSDSVLVNVANTGTGDAIYVIVHVYDQLPNQTTFGNPYKTSIDNLIDIQAIPIIPSGDSAVVSVEVNWDSISAGDQIYIWVDPYNEISEIDEDNNIASRNPTAPMLFNGSVTPSSGEPGTSFTFTVIYLSMTGGPPNSVEVNIVSTVDSSTSTYSMDPKEPWPSYEQAVEYTFTTTLESGNYTYNFEATIGGSVLTLTTGADSKRFANIIVGMDSDGDGTGDGKDRDDDNSIFGLGPMTDLILIVLIFIVIIIIVIAAVMVKRRKKNGPVYRDYDQNDYVPSIVPPEAPPLAMPISSRQHDAAPLAMPVARKASPSERPPVGGEDRTEEEIILSYEAKSDKKIMMQKTTIPCSECGFENNAGTKFCCDCGNSLIQLEKPRPSTERAPCEAPYPDHSEYPCNDCGRPLTFVHQYQRWYCYNCDRYY